MSKCHRRAGGSADTPHFSHTYPKGGMHRHHGGTSISYHFCHGRLRCELGNRDASSDKRRFPDDTGILCADHLAACATSRGFYDERRAVGPSPFASRLAHSRASEVSIYPTLRVQPSAFAFVPSESVRFGLIPIPSPSRVRERIACWSARWRGQGTYVENPLA